MLSDKTGQLGTGILGAGLAAYLISKEVRTIFQVRYDINLMVSNLSIT